MLEPDSISLLASKSTSPQIQEAILKDPIRIIKDWKDIKLGHSLEDFYYTTLAKLLNLPTQMNHPLESKTDLY